MNNISRVAILGFALSASSLYPAQSTPPAAPSKPAPKRSQGVLDYALGKINPDNKDYGNSAADARSELVGYTIQNIYFWSNVLSLSLLAATSTALVLILRAQDKREIIAANLISQLWNGRVIDRREIVRRTGMYNTLVETKNAALNQTPSPNREQPSESQAAEQPSQKQTGKKTRVPSEAAAPKSPASHTEQVETGIAPSGELQQKTTLLQGQNQALRNSERNLRERLNQVSQDLEQERRRNQTLKGA
ncbi:hypothetical protein ACPOL_6175 [Acidisarcina polymorpha]|uniref:Uncharacterized protein n=1 Tax=Acidisarcina polymorpha TaxID=2211140 RepID=A0A2Z5G8V1_9BACT|nr:hypothetical protein [Acidisarcina polymorpha]AXC15419.1 hypothetical protein ACPOL_6175 [Acidisarcina polymorpha]